MRSRDRANLLSILLLSGCPTDTYFAWATVDANEVYLSEGDEDAAFVLRACVDESVEVRLMTLSIDARLSFPGVPPDPRIGLFMEGEAHQGMMSAHWVETTIFQHGETLDLTVDYHQPTDVCEHGVMGGLRWMEGMSETSVAAEWSVTAIARGLDESLQGRKVEVYIETED